MLGTSPSTTAKGVADVTGNEGSRWRRAARRPSEQPSPALRALALDGIPEKTGNIGAAELGDFA